jgi:hypothetical protein
VSLRVVKGDAPQVSFVVPAYNAAATLAATLDSLAAQTFADWEAVVVDDGSRDRTASVALARSKLDPRIRVVRQPNGGSSAARNRGIAEARGLLIGFLDADDWIAPTFLETLVPLADRGRAVGYCAYRRVLPSGRISPVDWCPELEVDPFGVLVQRCEPAIHCMLVPRAVLGSVGGFDVTLRTCEDWDLWLRIARTGIAFRGTAQALASYRMRAYSLSTGPALGDDAGRVLAIARTADPRVDNPAPPYAQGWREAPGALLASLVAAQCARVEQGLAPERDWIVEALGEDWRQIIAAEPADIVDVVVAAAATTSAPDRVCDTVIASIAQTNAWTGALLSDWRAMAQADTQADAVFEADLGGTPRRSGRWLALNVDPRRLPEGITPPPGCDALLLVCSGGNLPRRQVALPLHEPLSRARLAQAVLDLWSLPELCRIAKVWRSPRFLAGLSAEAFAVLRRHGLRTCDRRQARWMAGTVVRRALARFLGAPLQALPSTKAVGGEVAVLLFDRIVEGIAGVLDVAIGTVQVADLLTLLAEEGYETISLADLEAARRGSRTLPPRPLVLVFADPLSALANGVLEAMPPALTTVEMLFDPGEITRGLPARAAGTTSHVAVRGGLRVRHMPLDCRAAIAQVSRWRAQLAEQFGGEVPIGAFTDLQGLAPALLQEAGFGLVLAPGTGQVRVDLPSPIIPVLECFGSGAIGDVLENLRPAA